MRYLRTLNVLLPLLFIHSPAVAGSPTFGVHPDLPPGCDGTETAVSDPTSLAIPSVATVTATIEVLDFGFVIHDLNVQTFIRHSYNGDLQVSLTSPSGTKVALTTGNAGSSDDVFNGTIWDDQAGEPVTQHAFTDGVIAETLVPEGALGAFRYENPAGTWILAVTDTASGDEGMLDGWGLSFMLRTPDSGSNPYGLVAGGTIEIADASTISLGFGLSNLPGYLDKVSITTQIRHTWNADLTIKLISPMGTEVLITQGEGGEHDDVFYETSWSDNASTPVSDAFFVNGIAQPELAPEGAFAALVGENPNGLWQLSIEDLQAPDPGVLESWGLFLTFATCERDFGDAPESYSTLEEDDGAHHYRFGDVSLGASIDFEGDGRPSVNATGDDNDASGDDEDGVIFATPLIAGEIAAVSAASTSFGLLNAWMDFGGDGTWEQPGDWAIQDGFIAGTTTSFSFVVPATATTGTTFARFRLAAGLFIKNGAANFKGAQNDGEVEDYQVTIYRHGSVHGFVYSDFNVDGAFSEFDDSPLEGAGVNLVGFNAIQQFVTLSAVTDSNGEFAFENLLPGEYSVSQQIPIGVELSTGDFQLTLEDGEEWVAFPDQANLPPGDPRTEVVVGESLMFGRYTYGSFHAFKFEDLNLDGEYDADTEPPLPGVPFELTGLQGAVSRVHRLAVSDASGFVDFENLTPGHYLLEELGFPGYSATTFTNVTGNIISGRELVGRTGQARLGTNQMVASLNGVHVVPPVLSSASGQAFLSLDDAGQALHYSMTIYGLDFGLIVGEPQQTPDNPFDDVNGMAFYAGVGGATGTAALELLPFTQDSDDRITTLNPEGSVTIQGVWEETDPALLPLSDFAPDIQGGIPEGDMGLFLEVQTNGLPNGEIRGQIYKIDPALKTEIQSSSLHFGNALFTPTPTNTTPGAPTPTPTNTTPGDPSPTSTPTETQTATATNPNDPTATPTPTSTTSGDSSPTPTATTTGSPEATATETATPTQTEVGAATATPTPTGSLELTPTPSATEDRIPSDCDLNGDNQIDAKDLIELLNSRPVNIPDLLYYARCWREELE